MDFLFKALKIFQVRPICVTGYNISSFFSQDYSQLRKLLVRCETVTAVKYLPDVLHLLGFLCDTYHSKYSREEAGSIKISSILQQINDGGLRDKVKKWVTSYVLALKTAYRSIDCE